MLQQSEVLAAKSAIMVLRSAAERRQRYGLTVVPWGREMQVGLGDAMKLADTLEEFLSLRGVSVQVHAF